MRTDPPPSELIPRLSPAQLREALTGGHSCLVAFSAPWCFYDLPLLPRLARLHHLLGGRLSMGRVDVGECLELVQALNIRWIPAVGHIHQGRLVRRWYGAEVDVEQVHSSICKRERS